MEWLAFKNIVTTCLDLHLRHHYPVVSLIGDPDYDLSQ